MNLADPAGAFGGNELPFVPAMNVLGENMILRDELLEAISRVIAHGQFMLGPEIDALEAALTAMHGGSHAVAVNSGTDALLLALKTAGVGPGDEVITVANSFVATAGAIRQAGALPHFVDVGADENMCPDSLAREIGPRTRAVVPVHLRGRPADMARIAAIAAANGSAIIEDAAQAIGASVTDAAGGERLVGTIGAFGCFSMHPQKVLGAIGDGGVVICGDRSAAEQIRLYRHHGLAWRDHVQCWGQNSRLDSIQAAVLLVKLRRLPEWIERRRRIAATYLEALGGLDLTLPSERPGDRSVFYHFSVMCERRDALRRHLAADGIDARIHYPVPIHRQPAAVPGTIRLPEEGLPNTEWQAARQLTLPVHHDLTDGQIDQVVQSVRAFFSGARRASAAPRPERAGGLAIGCCIQADEAGSPYLRGFDYCEVPLSHFEDGADGEAGAGGAGGRPSPLVSMGVFARGSDLFLAPDSEPRARERIAFVTRLLQRSGVEAITFGAGAARSIPAGMDPEEGELRLAAILGELARSSAEAGIRLFVENLPSVESNVFNRVAEMVDFFDRRGIEDAQIVYDLRAAAVEGDDPEDAVRHVHRIGHLHLPYPETLYPGDAWALVARLVEAGYRGRISVEPYRVAVDPGVSAFGLRLREMVAGLDGS
ncbi:MAG TPA: DegT/DnrJ/EryC1/StrS family aminotransferase [Allosphingosinicella sp.]|jgi:dTDP-4-amino-4,6-dideoxygalactose transaminase/sugar phosphate isomerase/epimerase|nr:DegT/DnrJ/EryC1/StrS family aminotransferase [Allosphingosinicella sp.]